MPAQQPEWKCVAQIGDAHPIDHGGVFIFEDTTGVYRHEVDYLDSPDDEPEDPATKAWTVYRFIVEPCTYDPETDVLSDNPHHPQHPAWFAKPERLKAERPQDNTYLSNVADTMGIPRQGIIDMFLSGDVRSRASAWIMIGEYHGFINLDQYPLQLTRAEVEARYKDATPAS